MPTSVSVDVREATRRARWLLRLLRQRGLQACGCWVRRAHRWCWLGSATPPGASPSGQKVWPHADVLVVTEPPLEESDLHRVRRAWRRHEERQLARRFVAALNAQRETLGNVLHRGPCQSMTVAQLQSGLLNMSEGEEREEARRDLENVLEQATGELRGFYENRLLRYPQGTSVLTRRWPQLDWPRLTHPELWFELLVCAWDSGPDVAPVPGGLSLTFSGSLPDSEVWRILLRLFPLFGYTLEQTSPQTLVLQPKA